MKQRSIKVNYIMNTVSILLTMFFPLVTFPYITRILNPDGVGKVTFANSIIAYFIMLSSIGIPIYGVRECAKVREDKEKLSKLVQELVIINFVFTVLAYALFLITLQFSNKLYNDKGLFILLSTSILFTTLGVEWLYQALEEYTFITIRKVAFQIVSVILLFLIVNGKEDYMKYAGLLVFSSVGSNITNFIYLRKKVKLRKFKKYEIKAHIKPIFTLFGMSLAASIYTNLDTVMLGWISNENVVGLYSAAVKINKILVTLVVSLGTVLVPRISYYVSNNMKEEFDKLIFKSLEFIFMLSLPIMVGLFLLAKVLLDTYPIAFLYIL